MTEVEGKVAALEARVQALEVRIRAVEEGWVRTDQGRTPAPAEPAGERAHERPWARGAE